MKMYLSLSLLIFQLISAGLGGPIVEIADGQLEGKVFKDFDGNDFFSFRSVPYAKPPIGDERFKDPKPVEKWVGIKDATEDMPICYQHKGEGTEDCLYLNVHTPEISPEKLKPVMFFIHSGGFIEGTGRHDLYGPEFFMITGIVLVTINYRLGIFGFTNFDNPDVNIPGNAGLKDQLMALKWVKENIRNFGGDPDNVTIFGESSGAASVQLHILSPASQGYFHRGISMSGMALAPWCNGMKNIGVLMARQLGYEGNDEMEMLKLIQNADYEQINKMFDDFSITLRKIHVINSFGPIIENQNENAFLTDSVSNLIKKGDFNKVPYMVGYTNQEGMILEVFYLLTEGKYDPWPLDWYIPRFFNISETQKENLVNEIESFYFKDGRTTQKNIDLGTDGYLTWSTYDSIFGHMKQGQDIFFYLFSSDTKMNRLKLLHPITANYKGACHIDILGYLFTSSFMPEIVKDSIEDKSIRTTVNLFANFAKYGCPTREGFDVEWTKTNPDTLNCIEIENDNIKIGYAPNIDRVKFWANAFKKYSPETETFYN